MLESVDKSVSNTDAERRAGSTNRNCPLQVDGFARGFLFLDGKEIPLA